MPAYDIGNKIRVTGTFTNPLNNDAKVDPDTVNFSACSPSGDKTHYEYGTDEEVVKSSTGVYYFDLPLDEAGNWWVRWWGLDSFDVETVAEEIYIKCKPHRAVGT